MHLLYTCYFLTIAVLNSNQLPTFVVYVDFLLHIAHDEVSFGRLPLRLSYICS